MPLMAHLSLAYPQDELAGQREDQFLFGPDLLAAPVLDAGAVERELYLPEGEWIDLWRAARYDPASGGLDLAGAQRTPGSQVVTVPAPLDELPLFVRAGAVLPLLSPDVDTLTGFDADNRTVRRQDRDDQLHLLAFPHGDSESGFYESGRLRSTETDGRWTLEIDDDQTRTITLQASLATLREPFEPCSVALDGRPLDRESWSFDRQDQALDVEFETASGLLEVSPCAGAGPAVASGADGAGTDARAVVAEPSARTSTELPRTGPSAVVAVAALVLLAAGLGVGRHGRRLRRSPAGDP